MSDSGFELFETTADVGILAWGKTLEELFANAARGMF
ncbi:MAG: archease, partial [candidate division NC10 bacterium]|nr:archease [candidate division NC10 bacterium]